MAAAGVAPGAEPMDVGNSGGSGPHADPAQPASGGGPPQSEGEEVLKAPAQSAQSTQAAQWAQSAKPAQSAQSVQLAQPVHPFQPRRPAEPATQAPERQLDLTEAAGPPVELPAAQGSPGPETEQPTPPPLPPVSGGHGGAAPGVVSSSLGASGSRRRGPMTRTRYGVRERGSVIAMRKCRCCPDDGSAAFTHSRD
mmetsp:Transcript_62160/g.200387  ORF Transcript_62160/g.200387 Transcript_62160/m.200387 type:complete len:196 (-) Transcript_62160:138-725(-)